MSSGPRKMEGGPKVFASDTTTDPGTIAVGVTQPSPECFMQQELIKSSSVKLKGENFRVENNMCGLDEQSPCNDSFVRLKIGQPSVLKEVDHHHAKMALDACPPALSEGISNLDIDKGKSAKKVMPVVPEEDPEEISAFEKLSIKRKSQKRPVSTIQTAVPMPPSRDCQTARQFSGDVLKHTHDLISGAKSGQANAARGIIYQPEVFSGFNNIESAPHPPDKGSFGEVRKAVDNTTKKELVIKRMTKLKDISANEITVPIQFPDVWSIAQTYACKFDGSDFYIVMEDAGESLRSLINNAEFLQRLKEPLQQELICLHIVSGVAALSKAGVTHCDIKPENACYSMKSRVTKLVDFGSSKTPQDCGNFFGTTVEYADPQACQVMNQIVMASPAEKANIAIPRLGEKYDVWASVMVSMFLIVKKHPMVAMFYHESGNYPNIDPRELSKIRYLQVAPQIAKLTDESLWVSLSGMMGQVSHLMWTVLRQGLRVNENDRPQATVLRDFLQEQLYGADESQPRKKAKRMEVDTMEMPVEDEEMIDVDLKSKADQPAHHTGYTYTSAQGIPGDTPIEQGPALVAMKMPAPVSHQTGKILAPVKLGRASINPPFPEQRMQQARRKVEPQDDYNDLVGFLLKPSSQSAGTQVTNEPNPSFLPQATGWAAARSQAAEMARLKKVEPPYSPPGVQFAAAVMDQPKYLQGLTGCQIEPNGSPVKPSGVDQEHMNYQQICGGNIPFIVHEEFNSGDELCRLKATARRRSRASND